MQASTAVINATGNIKEDTWYQITTNITDNTATTNLSYDNGTLIESTSNPNSSNQTVLLITNNEDAAVVLKNLTIQTQSKAHQPQSTQKPTISSVDLSLALYATASILLAATIAAILYVRKQRKSQKQRSNSLNAIKWVQLLSQVWLR
jgi:hypothetical protein